MIPIKVVNNSLTLLTLMVTRNLDTFNYFDLLDESRL